jgi:hypothetical protein
MAKHSEDKKLFNKKTIKFEDGTDYITISESSSNLVPDIDFTNEYTVESWISVTEIPNSSEFTYADDTASAKKNESTLILRNKVNLNDYYTSDRLVAVKYDGSEITLTNLNTADFPVDSRVLVIEMQANSTAGKTTVGNYEFVEIDSHLSNSKLKFKTPLKNEYNFSNKLYVVYTERYEKIIVDNSAVITCSNWSTNSQYIDGLILLCADEIIVEGHVNADGRGFRGGSSAGFGNTTGARGEGIIDGLYNNGNVYANYTGGGGGGYKRSGSGDVGTSGAGGANAYSGGHGSNWEGTYARGGTAVSNWVQDMDTKIFLGGGAGQGAGDGAYPAENCSSRGGYGGRGGGIIILDAENTSVIKGGVISCKGQAGAPGVIRCNGEPGSGGGGAGGSIVVMGNLIGAFQKNTVDANAGPGGPRTTSGGGTSSPGAGGGQGSVTVKGFREGNAEGWINPNSSNCSYILDCRIPFASYVGTEYVSNDDNHNGFCLIAHPVDGGYKLSAGSNRLLTISETLSFDRYYHIAISRNSVGLEAFFVDGQRSASHEKTSVYKNNNFLLGANSIGDFKSPCPFTGFLQDFRVTQNNLYDCTTYTLPIDQSEQCADPTPSPSKSPSYSKSASASFEFPDGCPTRVVPYWGGTTGGGTRSGPSNLENAFDGKDETRTGWVSISHSGSWKQDRFYFNDTRHQTPGFLRFYMVGGVNSGYGNRADMYIRYHEHNGPWVYLRNVSNSYMPRDQHFKYEINVNSLARVDVYWKDRGKGSINYYYNYIDFEQYCFPKCDTGIFHVQNINNERVIDRSGNKHPIEFTGTVAASAVENLPDSISVDPAIKMHSRFANDTNIIESATLVDTYSIVGTYSCEKSVKFANAGYAYFDNWNSEPNTLSFEIDFKINSHSNTATGGADSGSQYIVHSQNFEEESHTDGIALSYNEGNRSLSVHVTNNPPSQPVASTDSNTVIFGERTHVVVTISNSEFKVYINGELKATQAKTSGISYHPHNKLTLGRANLLGQSGFDQYMNGEIFDFRLWDNQVLNDNQVVDLYELRNTYVDVCSSGTIVHNQKSFSMAAEDVYMHSQFESTGKIDLSSDFTAEFLVNINDFSTAPSLNDIDNQNGEPVGQLVWFGERGVRGLAGIGYTSEGCFYTGINGSVSSVLSGSSTGTLISSSTPIFKLNSISERTKDGSGNTTTYLATDTTLYRNLVNAIDFWNKTVAYPDAWLQYKGGGTQQIELDIYVEDFGEINTSLPSYQNSAMSENTVARASFKSASGPKINNKHQWGQLFPESGFIRINRKFIDNGHFDAEYNGHTDMYYTIRHELVHILGINSTFLDKAVIPDAPVSSYIENATTKYYYTGSHGLEAYKNAISDLAVRNGIVGIPIEDDGGSSSAGGHWEEGTPDRTINGKLHPGLDKETMTPLHDDEDILSNITLSVLKDMGYTVDLSRAEPFYIGSSSHAVSTSNKNYLFDSTVRTTNTWYTIALVYRSNMLSLYVDGHRVTTAMVTYANPNSVDSIAIGAADGNSNYYTSMNGSIQDVRVVQTSLYDREYYRPRTFLMDACSEVHTPTPTPTATYTQREIYITKLKVDDDSELYNVTLEVMINDSGGAFSALDYWGYSVNGGPVIRVYDGIQHKFTHLVDGKHSVKVYYFTSDHIKRLTSTTGTFTIVSPELTDICNQYRPEYESYDQVNATLNIDVLETPKFSSSLVIKSKTISVNADQISSFIPTKYTFPRIISSTGGTTTEQVALQLSTGGGTGLTNSTLDSSRITFNVYASSANSSGYIDSELDIIAIDIETNRFKTQNNSRSVVSTPGNCDLPTMYSVDLSQDTISVEGTKFNIVSFDHLMTGSVVLGSVEIKTTNKSLELDDRGFERYIFDNGTLSSSYTLPDVPENIVLEVDAESAGEPTILEKIDKLCTSIIFVTQAPTNSSSLVVNKVKITVNNNETN